MIGAACSAGAMVEVMLTRYEPPFINRPLITLQHRRWNFCRVMQLSARSNTPEARDEAQASVKIRVPYPFLDHAEMKTCRAPRRHLTFQPANVRIFQSRMYGSFNFEIAYLPTPDIKPRLSRNVQRRGPQRGEDTPIP